jgi:transposase
VESATSPNRQGLTAEIEALRAQLSERERVIAAQREQIKSKEERIASLEHRVHVLAKLVFGPSSEKGPSAPAEEAPGQGWLFVRDLALEADRTAEETHARATLEVRPGDPSKKRHGRRAKFPDHLPRVRTTYDLPEEEKRCACGEELSEIGEEVTRELERVETAVVHEIARKKYACRKCEGNVRIAPGPDRVIEKGLLGTGFLAHAIVERFGQHLPYYRLEKKYAAEGLDLSRVVLCQSMGKCAQRLKPIYDELKRQVLASDVLHTDDTPVTMADSSLGGRRQGRIWIYLDRERRHFYDFTESRKRDGPIGVLGNFKGYLHADRYGGYEELYWPGGATEVACWAHARRKYDQARTSEPKLAAEALRRIAALYAVERETKEPELQGEALAAYRREHARPLLEELCAWLALAQTQVLEKSPMAQAIRYTLSNWEALGRYVEDGRLSIDNNAAEAALRPFAVGRKNWLFFGNDNGGRTAAILMSLLMTAKAAGLEPRQYFRDVLIRVGKGGDVADLTPHGWKRRFEPQVKADRERLLGRLLGRTSSPA